MTTPLAGDALAERAVLCLRVPLQRALGVALLDPARPQAGVGFAVGDLAGNGAGGMHAGAPAVGLELAALLAVLPYLAPSEHAVTASTATTLASSAGPGQWVEFPGAVDRRTGRLAFTTVVASAGDALLARAAIVKSVIALTGSVAPSHDPVLP